MGRVQVVAGISLASAIIGTAVNLGSLAVRNGAVKQYISAFSSPLFSNSFIFLFHSCSLSLSVNCDPCACTSEQVFWTAATNTTVSVLETSLLVYLKCMPATGTKTGQTNYKYTTVSPSTHYTHARICTHPVHTCMDAAALRWVAGPVGGILGSVLINVVFPAIFDERKDQTFAAHIFSLLELCHHCIFSFFFPSCSVHEICFCVQFYFVRRECWKSTTVTPYSKRIRNLDGKLPTHYIVCLMILYRGLCTHVRAHYCTPIHSHTTNSVLPAQFLTTA